MIAPLFRRPALRRLMWLLPLATACEYITDPEHRERGACVFMTGDVRNCVDQTTLEDCLLLRGSWHRQRTCTEVSP